MIRVMLADDHPVVRIGFRKILGEYRDIEVTGEVESYTQLLNKIEEVHPDILILDLSMEGGHFSEQILQLRQLHPDVRVLVATVHSENAYALACMEAGASGYLEKSTATEELVKAVRTVAKGAEYLSPAISGKLLDGLAHTDDSGAPHTSLSNREAEIFPMLVSGMRTSIIAGKLGLSPKTVASHRSNIFRKLGVTSNTELVRYAMQYDLVDES